jgi:pimeloyl-ACP methyl ester carboxylesterase
MTTSYVPAVCSEGLRDALSLLEERFPERTVAVGDGIISYRSCGRGPAVVLLHGIGSGAASWLHCALRLEKEAQVIAWNAPGYGRSSPLPNATPSAADYALRLDRFLRALGITRCVLVGHSLGAMMASAYVSTGTDLVSHLCLLSPAQGYGSLQRQALGQQVEQERLTTLNTLGVQGMAERSGGRMLSAQANDDARAWVRWNTLALNPAGYTQAVRMLCSDDIHRYPPKDIPASVYCGSADTITPPDDCRTFAGHINFPFKLIDHAGHACYIEQPDIVANAIREACLPTLSKHSHE